MAEEKSKKVTETPDGRTVVRTVGRDFRVEGNDVDGYIGVSPEYRGYANETDKPYVTDEDIALLEKGGVPTDVEALTLKYSGAPAVESESTEEPVKQDESKDKSNEEPKAPVKPAAKASS
jgi:hypothetical protein